MNFVNTFRNVYKASVLLAVFVWMACDTSEEVFDDAISFSHCEADWVRDAVFYQIFPERFRNGDPDNDPIRASIDNVDQTPSKWEVMPWTDDWYVRSEWERELGDDFTTAYFVAGMGVIYRVFWTSWRICRSLALMPFTSTRYFMRALCTSMTVQVSTT